MIFLGADHRGYALKEALKAYLDSKKISYEDIGTFREDPVDYPTVVRLVVSKILQTPESRGVLVCGSGIGVSIAANRHRSIRAALCVTPKMAEMARRHNNANVVCMGTSLVDTETAQKIVDVFLKTGFEGGRHERRVALLDDSDVCCCSL